MSGYAGFALHLRTDEIRTWPADDARQRGEMPKCGTGMSLTS
jgi:hypothetical protein